MLALAALAVFLFFNTCSGEPVYAEPYAPTIPFLTPAVVAPTPPPAPFIIAPSSPMVGPAYVIPDTNHMPMTIMPLNAPPMMVFPGGVGSPTVIMPYSGEGPTYVW
jgi:hypothetical protein